MIRNRKFDDAVNVFRQQSQLSSNETIIMILKMMKTVANRQITADIHQCVPERSLACSRIQCLLIDCYSKLNSNCRFNRILHWMLIMIWSLSDVW